ncbi:hypothetical protein HDU67_007960 [Dinochytrium kinnereticum]|nr:hypothetical protein HDU67_007960 [Dinochytrium kinnereticum]
MTSDGETTEDAGRRLYALSVGATDHASTPVESASTAVRDSFEGKVKGNKGVKRGRSVDGDEDSDGKLEEGRKDGGLVVEKRMRNTEAAPND